MRLYAFNHLNSHQSDKEWGGAQFGAPPSFDTETEDSKYLHLISKKYRPYTQWAKEQNREIVERGPKYKFTQLSN